MQLTVQPEIFDLCTNEVHIWRANLDSFSPQAKNFEKILSADELERANHFYFQKDQNRFRWGRALLRIILGSYLHQEPTQITLDYNPFGKPLLAKFPEGKSLHFNLSHSQGIALYAVTQGKEIGIDIEQLRPDFPSKKIAERFFTAQESDRLSEVPSEKKSEFFFSLWTCKEAYLKAKGMGLHLPLDQFEVNSIFGELTQRLIIANNPQEANRWSIRQFTPTPGYIAAVAVEGDDWQMREFYIDTSTMTFL
jgi:4'-phosphopantetheinyl transferase